MNEVGLLTWVFAFRLMLDEVSSPTQKAGVALEVSMTWA